MFPAAKFLAHPVHPDRLYHRQFSAGPDCQHQCVIVRRYPVGPRADLLSGQQKKQGKVAAFRGKKESNQNSQIKSDQAESGQAHPPFYRIQNALIQCINSYRHSTNRRITARKTAGKQRGDGSTGFPQTGPVSFKYGMNRSAV